MNRPRKFIRSFEVVRGYVSPQGFGANGLSEEAMRIVSRCRYN